SAQQVEQGDGVVGRGGRPRAARAAVPARVVRDRREPVGHAHTGEVEVALLGRACPVQDQDTRLGLARGREVRVRDAVLLAQLWNDVVHTWLSMAYAIVAIILFVLMLYMARRGLRN